MRTATRAPIGRGIGRATLARICVAALLAACGEGGGAAGDPPAQLLPGDAAPGAPDMTSAPPMDDAGRPVAPGSPDAAPSAPDAPDGPDARVPPIPAPDAAADGPDAAPDGPDAAPPHPAPDAAPPDDTCRPARAEWEQAVRPVMLDRCGRCHGAAPAFGAPFGLLDYDGLLAGDPGDRRVDRIAARVAAGTMPPAGQPRLTDLESRRLLDWATCGRAPDAPVPGGFEVDVPVLGAPEAPPAEAEFFDLLAPDWPVPLDEDRYTCFVFEAPIRTDRFIRRIEAVIDEAAVLHHAVLMRTDNGRAPGDVFGCLALVDPVYAWGPGTGPLQFPEGGLRISPGQRFTLQIHYNNRGGVRNLRDSSGLRVYHADTVGPEVGMTALGPTDIWVPAGGQGQAHGVCDIRAPLRVVASWPHMHEVGYAFESWIEHADGSESPVMTLRGWDFHSQFLYDTPLELARGDRIHTRCTYRNPRNRPAGFGEGTEDEMCFNFLYHTPPMATPYCDRDPQNPPPDVPPPPPPVGAYSPGPCAPPVDVEAVPEARVGIAEGEPEAPVGAIPDGGTWVIEGGTLHVPTFRLPIGAVDPENTTVGGHGVLSLEGGQLALDFDSSAHIVLTDGRVFDVGLPMSFAGARRDGDQPGEVVVADGCGDAGEMRMRLGMAGDRLRAVYVDRRIGFPIWLSVTLRRLD